MIETFQVIIQLFIFHVLFLFPISPYIIQKLNDFKNINIFTLFVVNIIIHLFVYLIASFLKIDLKYLFLILIFLSCITFLFNFRDNSKFLIKNVNKLYLAFLIINLSIFIGATAEPILGWDGVSHWIYKASAYYQDLGLISSAGASTYPHLPGFVWGFFWKNSIVDHEYVGRFFLIFFYITSIFYSLNFISKNLRDEFKLLFVFMIILLTYDKSLFGGYNEYYIFSLLIITSGLLYIIIHKKNIKYKSLTIYLTLFYISSHLLLWMKQEGTFWSIILLSILIFFEKRFSKKFIHFFIAIISIGSFFTLKFIYYETLSLAYDLSLLDALSSITFKNTVSNIITITYYLFVSFFKYPVWLLIIACLVTLRLVKYDLEIYKIFLLFLLLNISFLYALMIHFSLTNERALWELVLKVSFDRIVLQSSGFFIIMTALILNHNFINRKRILKLSKK